VDPVTAAGLDKLVVRLSEVLGTTFVVVTHELNSIFAILDRCVLLDGDTKGIIATGKPSELRDDADDPRVLRFFRRRSEDDVPSISAVPTP
jgi:phospholipid/cholesterol/gamma-HCH transport system ATP-binding protein